MLKCAERSREREADMLNCAEYSRQTEMCVLKCAKTPSKECWNTGICRTFYQTKDHAIKFAELSRHTKPDILIYAKYSR